MRIRLNVWQKIVSFKQSKNWLSEYLNIDSKIPECHCQKYLLRRQFINMTWLNSSDKKLLQNHLLGGGDYLLMLSDFMAIVLLSLTRRGKYALHFTRNSKIWREKSEDSCCCRPKPQSVAQSEPRSNSRLCHGSIINVSCFGFYQFQSIYALLWHVSKCRNLGVFCRNLVVSKKIGQEINFVCVSQN